MCYSEHVLNIVCVRARTRARASVYLSKTFLLFYVQDYM
jgi:hypothetical protein